MDFVSLSSLKIIIIVFLAMPKLSFWLITLIILFTFLSCFYYSIAHIYIRRGGNFFKSIWLDYTNLVKYINFSILSTLEIKLISWASSNCNYTKFYHTEFSVDVLFWLSGVVKLLRNVVVLMSRPLLLMLFIFTLNFVYILLILSIPSRLVFTLFWLLRLLSYKLSSPTIEIRPLRIPDFTARWPLCILTFRLWPDLRQSNIIPILDKYKLLNSNRSDLRDDLEPWDIEDEIKDNKLEVSDEDFNLMLDYWYMRSGNPDDWRRGVIRELLDLVFLLVIYEPYTQTFAILYLLSIKITKKKNTNQTIFNYGLLTKGFFFFIYRFIFILTSYPVKAIWISTKSIDIMIDLYRTDPNYKINNIKKVYIYKDLDFFFFKLHTLILQEYIWKTKLEGLRIYRNKTSIWNFNGKTDSKKVFIDFTKFIKELGIVSKTKVILHKSSRFPHLYFNVNFTGSIINNSHKLINQSNLSSLIQSTVKEPQFSNNKYTWLGKGSFLIKSGGKVRSMYPFDIDNSSVILENHFLLERKSTKEYENVVCEHFLINFLFSTDLDHYPELNHFKKEILDKYSEIIDYDLSNLGSLNQKQIIAACYNNNYYPVYINPKSTTYTNLLFFALHGNHLPILIKLDRDLLDKLLPIVYSTELNKNNIFLKDLYYTLKFNYSRGNIDTLKHIYLENDVREDQLMEIHESLTDIPNSEYTTVNNFNSNKNIAKIISFIFKP